MYLTPELPTGNEDVYRPVPEGLGGRVIRVNSLVVLISMVLGGDRYNWYSPPLSPLPIGVVRGTPYRS